MVSLRRGEVDREDGSLAGPIVQTDRSSMGRDDLPGNTQPQAGSLAVCLGRHPWIEDTRHQLRWNPTAGVFDIQMKPIVYAS